MPPSDNDDALRAFIDQIDQEAQASELNPLELETLSQEARIFLAQMRAAYERLFADFPASDDPLRAMVDALADYVEGVRLEEQEGMGIFHIPGMAEPPPQLRMVFVNWAHVNPSFSTASGLFLPNGADGRGADGWVGRGALADVWAIPNLPTGLVWSHPDHDDGRVQTHFPEHGFHRPRTEFTYGIPPELLDYERAGLPQVFFGPVWTGSHGPLPSRSRHSRPGNPDPATPSPTSPPPSA